ncbi:hypothetical protein RAG63_22110 [Klebsiella pneumoniae]
MASGTELLLYRVAAAPYPAYNPKSPLAQATAPPGDGIRHGAAFMPGGGCAYPAYSSGSDCLLARQATAPPADGIRHGAALCRVAAARYPAYSSGSDCL